MRLQLSLLVFGLLFVGFGVVTFVRGSFKWSPERILVGTQARMAAIGAMVGGAALVAAGLFIPMPLWERFGK